MATPEGPLTPEEGRFLLRFARQSLELFVREGRRAEIPDTLTPVMETGLGAFVTLHTREGELRGCIGTMSAHGPLIETIREMAIAAGTDDPRFPPVTARELANLRYEISVLSALEPMAAQDVVPGKHGLMVARGGRRGTLLPQVATEYGWNRVEFLEHTCRKAGLGPDAWKHPDTAIYGYTAQVFTE
jgi:hypothetical protein